jgi:hypothetical protein
LIVVSCCATGYNCSVPLHRCIHEYLAASSRQSCVNECWLTAARKGHIPGRKRIQPNPIMRFSAAKPPIFAQNGTRKSPLIMFGRRELIMFALLRNGAGPCGRKLRTYSLIWILQNKPNFHRILRNACQTARTRLQRSAAANGATLSTAEVSAAVDRDRLFQAYSKAHPRA